MWATFFLLAVICASSSESLTCIHCVHTSENPQPHCRAGFGNLENVDSTEDTTSVGLDQLCFTFNGTSMDGTDILERGMLVLPQGSELDGKCEEVDSGSAFKGKYCYCGQDYCNSLMHGSHVGRLFVALLVITVALYFVYRWWKIGFKAFGCKYKLLLPRML